MEFTIIDPIDGTMLELQVQSEDYNGEQGIRVLFPEKDSFVMVEKDGGWKVMDETDINPDLIQTIAEKLKPHTRYI